MGTREGIQLVDGRTSHERGEHGQGDDQQALSFHGRLLRMENETETVRGFLRERRAGFVKNRRNEPSHKVSRDRISLRTCHGIPDEHCFPQ